MQKLVKLSLCLLFLSSVLASCDLRTTDDVAFSPQTEYTPILMKRADLEASIKIEQARTLKNPGKIYTYGNYIFISERYEGIHIVDNSDPSNPVNISFIVVPGCVDMAVKSNVMYVDNAIDLVSLSIQDVNDIKVLNRNTNVFPELVPPDLIAIPDEYKQENRPENTIIIGWKKS